MTSTEKKELIDYLNEIRDIDKSIENKKRLIDEQRDIMYSVQSIQYGEYVQHSRELRPVEKKVLRFLELSEQLIAQINELTDAKIERIQYINQIEDLRIRNVMECRYIRRQSWNDIISDLHYDKSRIYQWHNQGLNIIYKSRLNRLE